VRQELKGSIIRRKKKQTTRKKERKKEGRKERKKKRSKYSTFCIWINIQYGTNQITCKFFMVIIIFKTRIKTKTKINSDENKTSSKINQIKTKQNKKTQTRKL
jgi:hypothetical protein